MTGGPTAAQKAARDRNHRIWRLRGAWWNHGPLSPERRARVRAIIDEELVELGAESQTVRAERERKERWGEDA